MRAESPGLARTLGLWDVTTITAGTILGSAIFVAAAFVPREVPHPTLVLLLWVAGGLIAIAGALCYAELGTMFPEPGGQYNYLKQAFGPLWGFLFAWTALLAIQAGPVAYLGVALGDYLGAFVPFFSSTRTIASIPVGPWTWEPNTAQLAGVSVCSICSSTWFASGQCRSPRWGRPPGSANRLRRRCSDRRRGGCSRQPSSCRSSAACRPRSSARRGSGFRCRRRHRRSDGWRGFILAIARRPPAS